jgi:hypothetical protein
MQRINILIAMIISVIVARANVTAVYNWSDPSSLTPAYTAPTSTDRYGEYIGNVEFSDNGVILKINDDDVKESSQKARFLYGYNTQTVEMRAYPGSDIIVTAPEGMVVSKVEFEGAKADESYMTPYDESGSFKNGIWTSGNALQEAKFYVDATINCTKITVICSGESGVENVSITAPNSSEEWFTLNGERLNQRPTMAGVYVKRINNTTKTVLIR